MQSKKLNSGIWIFLGMGPVVNLVFFMPPYLFYAILNSFESVAHNIMIFTVMSFVHYFVSLALLGAFLTCVVPILKKFSTFDFHCKNAWLYASFLSLPAAILGMLHVVLMAGTPHATGSFTVFSAVHMYLLGWLFGGLIGATSGVVILSLLPKLREE